jgi:hypothetical protein
MATITFDTLKFVEKLRAVGVSEAQAKVQAEVLVFALDEVMDQQLATKADIARLERDLKVDIARLEREFKAEIIPMQRDLFVLKWMMGMIIGGVTALVLKAFFPAY